MDKRSSSEIKAEWEGLNRIKSKIPHYSRYHIDNWELLDAMVQVLRHELSSEDIKRQYPYDKDVSSASEDAWYWMIRNECLSPVESWKPLAK
jgi:hypothetical protein